MARRGNYRLTPSRQRALRKAQLISARKRKGKGMSRGKRNAIIGATGVGTAVLLGGAAYGRHKLSGSSFSGPFPSEKTVRNHLTGKPVFKKVSLNSYEGGRFVLTGTLRGFGKDKTMFQYSHRPLTMEAVKSLLGRKQKALAPAAISGGVAPIKNPDIDQVELKKVARIPFDSLTRANRTARRMEQKTGVRFALAEKAALRQINQAEAMRRTNEYLRRIAKQGIVYNSNFRNEVFNAFKELGD